MSEAYCLHQDHALPPASIGEIAPLAKLPPDAPVVLMLPHPTPYRLTGESMVTPVTAVTITMRDLARLLLPLMEEEGRRWNHDLSRFDPPYTPMEADQCPQDRPHTP